MTYRTFFRLNERPIQGWPGTLLFRGTESLVENERQTGKPTEKVDNTHINITPSLPQSVVYYKNTATKKLTGRDNAEQEMVIVDDTLKPINWKVLADTKKIGQFNCQKATGFVRGRTYTAWFAPAVAVSTGPWKLYGLPGLILEAEDDTGEVKFIFESLTIPAPANSVIEAPKPEKNQKRMSDSAHKKYITEKFENLRKMLESKPTANGAEVTVTIGKPRGIELDD